MDGGEEPYTTCFFSIYTVHDWSKSLEEKWLENMKLESNMTLPFHKINFPLTWKQKMK